MYFKINKTSEIGQQLAQFFKRNQDSWAKFRVFAAEVSDIDSPLVVHTINHFGGAYSGIEFKQKPAKYWRKSLIYNHRHFYSLAANAPKELREKWSSLSDPIENKEICQLFGLKPFFGAGKYYSLPGITGIGNYYLIDIADEWANTVQQFPTDMVEIKTSQFYQLQGL